jgi:hypothetical protein
VFSEQLPIVKQFIFHLIYHRAISTAYNERRMENEFWTLTSDAHLLRATIDWCMVFGVDSNSTHWKQVLTASPTDDQSFREDLLMTLGMSEDQWGRYWVDMKYFRDKFAAHRQLNFSRPVPDFDVALKVTFYYDQWVRRLIFPDTIDEPAMESFASSLNKTTIALVARLMDATIT